jgi:transposase
MDRNMLSSRLVPHGFLVDRFDILADRVTATVRSMQAQARCPECGAVSCRIQSRYRRRASDLPIAGRRNHRYGTLVCDLERRRPVVLLKDREQATAEDWLKDRPSIAIVARDRGGGYGEATARALQSLVAAFGCGVIKDEAAVRAAIELPWSNGQTEGQITKLKLVKRQMYGRGKIDLLQARPIDASPP